MIFTKTRLKTQAGVFEELISDYKGTTISIAKVIKDTKVKLKSFKVTIDIVKEARINKVTFVTDGTIDKKVEHCKNG